jgi:hypothetical protein
MLPGQRVRLRLAEAGAIGEAVGDLPSPVSLLEVRHRVHRRVAVVGAIGEAAGVSRAVRPIRDYLHALRVQKQRRRLRFWAAGGEMGDALAGDGGYNEGEW